MSARQWQRLSRVYLERLRRPLLLMLGTLIPVSLFFASRHGLQMQEFVANLALVSALLPFGVGGIIAKSKADGSLAFIASLPVSRDDHARSWLAVVLLLTLPLAVMVMTMGYLGPLQLRGVPLIVCGLSATLLIASAVLTLNAFQLSAPPAMAAVYFLTTMAGITMFIGIAAEVLNVTPQHVKTLVRSELFFVGASAVVWAAAGAAFWWSWQRIGHFMTSYVGEPPKA